LSLAKQGRGDLVPKEKRNSASAGRSRHPSALAPHSAFPRSHAVVAVEDVEAVEVSAAAAVEVAESALALEVAAAADVQDAASLGGESTALGAL
jgi:hypothetical protein